MRKKFLAVIMCTCLLAITACGGKSEDQTQNAASGEDSGQEESAQVENNTVPVTVVIESENLIRFEPAYTVIDDENVKIEITSLTREIMNEGMENNEYLQYLVNYVVQNKNNECDVNVYAGNSAVSVNDYTVQFSNTTLETKAGKINDTTALVCIVNPNGTSSQGSEHVESLKDLLNLEAEFTITFMKDNAAQDTYTAKASFEGFEIQDLVAEAEAEQAAQREKYRGVYDALASDVWYFNGGSDTVLNRISFSDEGATIDQVYFDGNGKHDNGSTSAQFSVNDTSITVTTEDGNSFEISYTMDGEAITLDGGYLTAEEIDEQIQGYWMLRKTSFGKHEYHIYFNEGEVKSERASEALNGSNGDYYYYGPYEGSYTLNFGGFDTDMGHGSEWFFNIVDGNVVILQYDNACEKSEDGFPGENGYSF